MSVNGVNNYQQSYSNYSSSSKTNNANKSTEQSNDANAAAVYEPGKQPTNDNAKKVYKRDDVVVNQLKSDLDYRKNQLQGLVEKLLTKQGNKGLKYNNLNDLLKSGKLNVDANTVAKAQADIGEDGYWGVEQTSQRLFDMAIALSGGDPKHADKMINAMKKGFDQATKAWGGKLPDICKQTIDTAVKKMDDWRKSLSE